MKNLTDYIRSINPQLLRLIPGKVGDLIKTIQANNFLSEAALIAHICGSDRPRKYYLNLKSEAVKILQALMMVSTSKEDGEVKKKLDFCRKNFAVGQKFLGKGVQEEGLRLIKQAHRIAVEYDFVHLASELSSVLYYHYAFYERNKRLANGYAEQVDHYCESYRNEKKAEYHLYQVIADLDATLKPLEIKQALDSVIALDGDSLRYQTCLKMLYVIYGFNIGDYRLVLDQCQSTIEFLVDKKGVYRSHYFFFYNNMAIAQIALKRPSDAAQNLALASRYAHVRTINEKLVFLYQTINALHAGQYDQAYALYRAHRKCKFERIRQQFAIIEAYLCFLAHLGYLQLEGKFRIGKYLNDTFKAQSDKCGSNISIIIAELLVYLARNRGKFIDRIEAVNNYSYRHLKSEDTKRAKRFIKILCLLPRANFKASALRRIAARQIRYLEANPISMGNNVSIEIIPFEDLLAMILSKLERRVA